ncbi:MAG: hypothetical protein N2444_05830, partial [Methylocystis sp.]|nr:hypothetical protein [Methylocystis sp.]
MSGRRSDEELSARVAARIAAEPAFEALEETGAPIVAAVGEPLTIVCMNDSARAVFGRDPAALADRLFGGDDPAARRLAHLVDSLREGAALRLERLRLLLDSGPQTVTVLCRRLAEGDAALFAVAALGVRPSAAQENSAAVAGGSDSPAAPSRVDATAKKAPPEPPPALAPFEGDNVVRLRPPT